MPSCLVNKCLSKTGRKGQSREIALHRFPNDPVRIRRWLQQTGQSFRNLESLVQMIHEGQKQTKYWLCSIHFTADSYIHARVLRQDAIPSIFPSVREGESIIQENLKKVRLRGKKRPLQWTTTENMDVQLSSASEGIFPEDAEIRRFTWTGTMDAQSSGTSADILTEDTDIKPLRLTGNVNVRSSCIKSGIFSEDTDIRQFAWTGNMDAQSSSASAEILREDTDIKPFQLTGNMDAQLSSASACIYPGDRDIKPLLLARNFNALSSSTSANIFSEDADIKPLQLTLTANMDVHSSSTSADICPEDADVKPLQLTRNVNGQSSSTSADILTEDTDIKPLQLTANMDVQSPNTSVDIFPEDPDIRPNISKPRCCTIGTQTEFALCNSTVKFFDQEDKPPADPVATETPVVSLQSPVLSTPMAPTGKIALLDVYWSPRIVLLR